MTFFSRRDCGKSNRWPKITHRSHHLILHRHCHWALQGLVLRLSDGGPHLLVVHHDPVTEHQDPTEYPSNNCPIVNHKKKIERSVTIPLFLLKLSVLTVLFLFGVRTVHTARILRIRPGGGANIEPQHGKTCRKSAGNPINPSLQKAKCFPD